MGRGDNERHEERKRKKEGVKCGWKQKYGVKCTRKNRKKETYMELRKKLEKG